MAYTITYKFGTSAGVGEAVAGDHLVRMSIEFTVQDTGTNVEKFARDYGLHVADYGELVWDRDIADNLMIPGQFNFSLIDLDEELYGLMVEGSLVPVTEKDGLVTLEIKYYGDSDYTEEFVGNIDLTSFEYDKSNHTLSIVAIPKTDILKSLYLYNDDPSKPGYLDFTNHLGINSTYPGSIYVAEETLFKEVIHRIYKKINTNCSLSWRHDWKFRGTNYTDTSTYDYFTLEELKLSSTYLSCLFFSLDNQLLVETLYDLLIKFSFEYGFLTGMISANKAFVKELYSYDSGNTQTMDIKKRHKIGSKYSDIDAVRITARSFTRADKANTWRENAGQAVTFPSGATQRGTNTIDEEITSWIHPAYGSNENTLIGSYALEPYRIEYAKPPNVSTYKVLEEAVANFYYNLRSRKRFNPTLATTNAIGRVDDFIYRNIYYDYLKDFSEDGNGYQILTLKKKIAKNESSITALLVQDALDENTPDTSDPYPRPFTNILPGGYLKNYEYNAEVDAADANSGSGTLYSVTTGTLVKRIYMLFTQGFNNVTAVTITDSDGILKPTDEIIWDTDGAVLEVVIMRTYATNQDIVINFTTSGTVTTGAIDCVIELSRKD